MWIRFRIFSNRIKIENFKFRHLHLGDLYYFMDLLKFANKYLTVILNNVAPNSFVTARSTKQIIIGGCSKYLWDFFWLMCDAEIKLAIMVFIISSIRYILQWKSPTKGGRFDVKVGAWVLILRAQAYILVVTNMIVFYRIFTSIRSTELQILKCGI